MTQAITATTETQAIQTVAFDDVARHAAALAKSTVIPREYQGNASNCLIALEMASRMGCTPLQIMQSMHIIQGRPSFSAQWLIATVNASGRFSPLRWRFSLDPKGKKIGAVAYATEKESGAELDGPEVTLEMARAEKWGAKWQTMPDVMLMYRSAAFWARLYCPEVAMGLHTEDELEDVHVVQQQPSRGAFAEALGAMPEAPALPVPGVTDATSEPVDAPASFDPETGEVE